MTDDNFINPEQALLLGTCPTPNGGFYSTIIVEEIHKDVKLIHSTKWMATWISEDAILGRLRT